MWDKRKEADMTQSATRRRQNSFKWNWRTSCTWSKRQSFFWGGVFDLLLVFCKEHLYSLCGSWLLLLRSLKHQPSRLNFNTGSAKGYEMVAHNFRRQNCVKCFFFALNRLNELCIFHAKINVRLSKLLEEFLYKISWLLSSTTTPLEHFQGLGHVRSR